MEGNFIDGNKAAQRITGYQKEELQSGSNPLQNFVDLKKKIEIPKLTEDLGKYFKKNTDLEVRAVTQKFRIQRLYGNK